MSFPVNFIVFGATGDLMKRKILPALFHLYQSKDLPSDFKVLGVSRKKFSNTGFRKHIRRALEGHWDICSECNPKLTRGFLSNFFYVSSDVTKKSDYEKILKEHHKIQKGKCSNAVFYLSTPPTLYSKILENLRNSNLYMSCEDKWSRVVVEKPVGLDLASFQSIKKSLKGYPKKDLYFIDHYLGKEVLRRIKKFREENKLIKDLWDNKHIQSIEVRLWERDGVDERAPFYEVVGALKDVGQNHILEMIALTLMNLDKNIHAARNEVINSLTLFDQLKNSTYRAQYASYTEEKGVKRDSLTETYFELKLKSSMPKYQGIPIYVSAGKGMGVNSKFIKVNFSDGEFLSFDIDPLEGITQKLLSTQKLRFRRISKKSLPYLEEYQKLIFDILWGNRENFISPGEVEASWKLINPVVKKFGKEKSIETYSQEDVVSRMIKVLPKKSIGVVGLGKMGSGLALQLIDKGWDVVGYNKTPKRTKELEKAGLSGAYSLKELIEKLPNKKLIWLMVPHGKPVEDILFSKEGLANLLSRGDTIIDGGNSHYLDSKKRARKLKKSGINFIDVGVSGGPNGARNGACLMIGGETKHFKEYEGLFRDLSVLGGYAHFEGEGAGHFVKMVHNGIEYGIMQAIAEGFTILNKSKYKLDLSKIARVYNHGSVIESNLMGWLESALYLRAPKLKGVSGRVHHTGEGEWTVLTAKKMKLKAKIIEDALKYRVESKKNDYTGKIIAALREQFGGHNVK